jgi:A/G-specific adenine glycosylase
LPQPDGRHQGDLECCHIVDPRPDIAEAAARWFAAHARDLPWRRPGAGAWGILVSEIMLQQTPVARVEPVWQAWMARWPVPAALATEPPAEAIRAWGRLGYPRRALRLHECAGAIVARHAGVVPDELDDLLALPGVGAYTARAVAAFAYRRREPVVDTNVRRLLARAMGGRAGAGPTTTAGDLAAALALLPASGPAAARASAALMELGALVCTARSPRCHECPLWNSCAWRLAGAPAGTGPRRRPQRYAGTDRHVRGLLLAVLRESAGPVPRTRLDLVWPEHAQLARALAGLVSDGLVAALPRERFALFGAESGEC